MGAIETAFFIAGGTSEKALRIGMVDCILYALKSNTEIKVNRIMPRLKADDVKIAIANFEPTFSAEYTIQDKTEVAGNTLQGADKFNSQDMNFNLSASGKLITGTEYSLEYLNERYKSDSQYQIYNPYYTAEPKITITQPLFKGAGIIVNAADISIARNNKKQSDNSFKSTVMSAISKTKAAFYAYIYSLETYLIDKLAVERVGDLLETDRAKYQKGQISSVALLETEASLADKKKILFTSESQVDKAEDELKLITNLVDDPQLWNAKIEVLERPVFDPQHIKLLDCLKNAFDFRPDYHSAQLDLKNRDIKIVVAKNDLLPTLDLTGSFGVNGLGKDYESSLGKTNINYQDWGAGIKFSVPWGGADRAKFDQSKLEKVQALLELKRLEQKIILEVRDKVRKVNLQEKQVGVTKISKEKEEENYRAQKERYLAGKISTHDILDYQDKLSRAQLDYMRALIDYQLALTELDETEGLTLLRNNIKLEE